ncbi:reverse transcriptase domain-containing protein [Tanacetum coccineum]
MPTTTTMFAATTPENTPLAYRASTSTNPNLVISPAFMEANYETLESILRDRRRQMLNNDLRTELEHFSKDYDEEREMESRSEPVKAATLPLRAASPRVRRRRERVVGFEETQNRGESRVERNSEGGRPSEEASRGDGSQNVNLPPLLATHIGRSENGQPLQSSLTSVYGGQTLSNNKEGNLPHNEDYPLLDGLKMPSYIGSYDGKGDPDNFLHLFEGAIRMQKWLMSVDCHMFTYTLKDSTRIWWNSQKVGSILDYKDLKAKFLDRHISPDIRKVKEYTYALRFEFETTNNEAEYEALLAGLRIAQEMEITKVAIFLDSQLVVNQIKGNLCSKTVHQKLLAEGKNRTKRDSKVLVKVLAKTSIEEKEVLKVEIKEKRSWMSLIHKYLLSGLLPEDTKEARKIRIQVPQYKLIRGKLQKQFKTEINARNNPQYGKQGQMEPSQSEIRSTPDDQLKRRKTLQRGDIR